MDISLDVAHTPLLPHPHLGRNEIVYADAAFVSMPRNLEVERRIVDEHHMVGVPIIDGLPSRAQESQDGGQMFGHLDKSHIGHVAIVDDGGHLCGLLHQVTSQKPELRLMVVLRNGLDEPRPMQVARCFASYQEVFHF